MQRKAYLLIISFHPHNNFMKDGGTAIIVPTRGKWVSWRPRNWHQGHNCRKAAIEQRF